MHRNLPREISQVGKLRWHFTALFEGPDGDPYIPRWDIDPALLSNNDKFGYVMQKVVRRWSWFPYLYITIAEPIEVDSMTKWQGVESADTDQLHHHAAAPDKDGKTGMES